MDKDDLALVSTDDLMEALQTRFDAMVITGLRVPLLHDQTKNVMRVTCKGPLDVCNQLAVYSQGFCAALKAKMDSDGHDGD